MKLFVIFSLVLQFHTLFHQEKSQFLDRPPGAYQTLVEWKEEVYRCLIFKTPLMTKNKKIKGELFILESQSEGCSLGQGKRITLKNEIEALKIQNISYDRGLNFDLSLSSGEVFKFEFLFPDEEHSRWDSFFPTKKEKDKMTDIKISTGDQCLRRSNDCQVLGENLCDQCSSWTPFVDLNCSQKISGLCGANLCGGRGQKACLKMVSLSKLVSCAEVKPFVYCQFGLEVECQSNGEVTCR